MNSILKDLDILEILYFFHEENSIVLEDQVLGFEMKKFIMSVNFDKIRQLSREFFKDRPKKMPDLSRKSEKRREKNSEERKIIEEKAEKLKKERLLKRKNIV